MGRDGLARAAHVMQLRTYWRMMDGCRGQYEAACARRIVALLGK